MTPDLKRFTGIVERVSRRRWRWVLILDGSALACQYGVSDSEDSAEAMLHGFLYALFGDNYINTSFTDEALNDFLRDLVEDEGETGDESR